MPITPEQLEQRKAGIGSSDMAAIMTLDPWRNGTDVFLEKRAELTEQKANDAMKRGDYLEEALVRYAEDNLGPIDHDPEHLEFIQEEYHFIDHPDGLLLSNGEPIEAKSQGAFSKEHWGDAGTDDMPHRVIIQAHFHMICTNKDYCHVPVYLPFREFQMFGVERDKEICEIIIEHGTDFWNNHVLKDIPPEGQPSVDILKRIKREPESIVDIDYALIEAMNNAIAAEKVTKAAVAKTKAEAIAALGTAEAGKCKEGLFTYFEQHRKGYEVQPCSYRVARFKKGK